MMYYMVYSWGADAECHSRTHSSFEKKNTIKSPDIIIPGWWFQTVLFSIIYVINLPIDFHIFQDGYCTTSHTFHT